MLAILWWLVPIWYVIRNRKSWNLVWSGSNIHCWHCIGIVHCCLCIGIIHVSWESTQMSCRQRKTDLSNCRRLARWRSTYYRHHATPSLLCCHIVLERDTYLIWKWRSIISVGVPRRQPHPVQAWQPCPLWEPSFSHPILLSTRGLAVFICVTFNCILFRVSMHMCI